MTGSGSPEDWQDVVRAMAEDCRHMLALGDGLTAESFAASSAAV